MRDIIGPSRQHAGLASDPVSRNVGPVLRLGVCREEPSFPDEGSGALAVCCVPQAPLGRRRRATAGEQARGSAEHNPKR
ncbi:MAG: hypothetical protein ACYTKD_11885 [Planctomycetota bacterium]|jgi:hypothetical protein